MEQEKLNEQENSVEIDESQENKSNNTSQGNYSKQQSKKKGNNKKNKKKGKQNQNKHSQDEVLQQELENDQAEEQAQPKQVEIIQEDQVKDAEKEKIENDQESQTQQKGKTTMSTDKDETKEENDQNSGQANEQINESKNEEELKESDSIVNSEKKDKEDEKNWEDQDTKVIQPEEVIDPSALGTKDQYLVVEDYPTATEKEKLNVPYIEKQNGNLYAKENKYPEAISHYNKSLFALKMVFEGENALIRDQLTAVRYIQEIEIPVCLNLALCYNKVQEFHYAIKYASQVLDKDDDNSKALYRRGMAYLGIGELNKCKQDLTKAFEITQGKDNTVINGLKALKDKEEQHKKQERETAAKMIGANQKKKHQKQANHSQQSPQKNTATEEQGKVKDQDEKDRQQQNKSADNPEEEQVRREEMDSAFSNFLKLLRSILFLPFYIYCGLMEKMIKFFLKITFIGIAIAESVPIVGPKVQQGVEYLSTTRLFQWVEKFKQE